MPKVGQKINKPKVNLKTLAKTINDNVKRGTAAAIKHYREAGKALIKAKAELKKQAGHGSFGMWLEENCPTITQRRANQYMKLAKLDVTSNLEMQWRDISGNGNKSKTKNSTARRTRSETDEPEEGERTAFTLPEKKASEFDELVRFLAERFSITEPDEVVLRALRFCKEHIDDA